VYPEQGPLRIYDEVYKVFNELYPSLQSFFALSALASSKVGELVEEDNKVIV
jgi:xylulokinase